MIILEENFKFASELFIYYCSKEMACSLKGKQCSIYLS